MELEIPGLNYKIIEKSQNHTLMEITVRAKPGAKKKKVGLSPEGELILSFSARPVEGAANKEIMKILSDLFGVSPSQIELVRGLKSKQKTFSLSFSFTDHKPMSYYLDVIKGNFENIESVK